MIGVLRFTLPEEQSQFDLACRAGRLACALLDIYDDIRRRKKYENHGEATMKVLEDLHAFVASKVQEAGVPE